MGVLEYARRRVPRSDLSGPSSTVLVVPLALVLVVLVGACTGGESSGGGPLEIVERSTVIERDSLGYDIFRIPVQVHAPNGDLLLFCEGRKTSSDYGGIDILVFRSTDGGETWGGGTVVAENGTDTASDMAAVVDGGRVHLLYQERPGETRFEDYLEQDSSGARGYHMYSDDNGRTWSDPVEITDDVLPAADEQLPMFGPNNGIVLESGRLVVPMYYANQSADSWTPSVVYSDDNGQTWRRSVDPMPGSGVSETAVVQVPNGDVLAVARDGSGDGNDRKRFFRSTDGATTWSEVGDVDHFVPEVRCQQSMVARGDHLFLATPQKPGRTDGRLKTGTYDTSQPDNVDWNAADLQITPGGFAYSTMTIRDSTIHLVYEKKTSDGYQSLKYVQVQGKLKSTG